MRRLLVLGVLASGCIELEDQCGPSQACPTGRLCVEGVCAPGAAPDAALFGDGGDTEGG
ncbi:MAG: hypothetical protein R3F43_04900 [bacterium]